MTAPSPETIAREKDKLFVTDAELIRRLGIPEKKARVAIEAWDRNPKSGFPKKQKLMGGRRYMPAVMAYLEAVYGSNLTIDAARLATENRTRTRLPRRHRAELHSGEAHGRATPED